MRGMNPRQMQNLMKQMGIKSRNIPATEVVIRTTEGELIIKEPQVTEIVMQGIKTYQVMGEVTERTAPAKKYSDEDVKLIMEKTGRSKEEVEKALEETNGDLAEAILKLHGE